MSYTKRFVCLANSRKLSGRCIAGRELEGDEVGDWIRPVSARTTEEISLYDRRFEDGSQPELLDVLDVPMLQPKPHSCQTENHLIADDYYWSKVGEFPASSLPAICERPSSLWTDGFHSYSGINDRIPEATADQLDSSLVLIQPEELVLCVERGLRKLQVRAEFGFNGTKYKLTVTHPEVESAVLPKGAGRYPHPNPAVACVSIGEPFEGYRYKLIAALLDT